MSADTPEGLFREDQTQGKLEGSLSHMDALNKILANSCSNPAYYPDDDRTREYKIDLCCSQLVVIAQPIPDEKFGYVIFEVLTPSENEARVARMRQQSSLKF